MFARLAALALSGSLLLSGCATGWITTQATGTQRLLDEDVHEVHVPQPGITEHLTVTLPATAQAVTCAVDQTGHDLVYHQAFRYGSRWKKLATVMFLLEGAAATAFLLTASDKAPDGYVYGGFLALDAAITAPLIFIPRKEIYRTDDVPMTTAVRTDCPEGLAIEIAGDTFPVDAAGQLGELGVAALQQWQKTPGAPGATLRVDIAGQARELTCTPQQCAATIPFEAGALTSVAVATPTP